MFHVKPPGFSKSINIISHNVDCFSTIVYQTSQTLVAICRNLIHNCGYAENIF